MAAETKSVPIEYNYIKEILTSNVYDIAKSTSLNKTLLLSDVYSNNIFIKREDQQFGSSFKIRGVYNKIKKIAHDHKNLICASTGNHALAVSIVAAKFNCSVIAVMPRTVSQTFVKFLEKNNTDVILFGDNFTESLIHAKTYAKDKDFLFIDSFDDSDIIAGNATVGMEIVNQMGSSMSTVEAVFVPVGGGGLLSGIALYIKELYPSVKIIGVGLDDGCAMFDSFNSGKIINIPKANSFVESVSVTSVGAESLRLCKKYVDEIILVSIDETCSAIKHIYDDTKTLIEPASALSIAGLTKYIDREKIVGRNLIAVLSGGNIDFDKLRYISERSRIGDKSEVIVKIDIPEEPNSLMTLLKFIDNDCTSDSLNISQFHYRFNDEKKASILIGFSIGTSIATHTLLDIIRENYSIHEINDSVVNIYIPYLLGSSHKKITGEYLFSFTIPDRSGALAELLSGLNDIINITMFHYRNIGDSYGNILMGLQLINIDYDRFISILSKIKIVSFVDQTNNTFIKLFY